MTTLTFKKVKEYADNYGKSISFNRCLGGYQVVTNAFTRSETVVPARDSKGRIYMAQGHLRELLNLI